MKLLLSLCIAIYAALMSSITIAHSNHDQPLEGSLATQIFHFMTSPNHLLFTSLCFVVITTILIVQKRRANKINRWVIQTKEARKF